MILFMGVSGAGKGTQGELLARDINYTHLVLGDLLRLYASPAQKQLMADGILLEDNDVAAIIDTALKALPERNNVVLDGFPRTLTQAEWLVSHTQENNYCIEAVLNLQVSASVVLERLIRRGRVDDTPEAIEHRIKWYNTNAQQLIEYYQLQQLPFHNVDGNANLEAVHNTIMQCLGRTTTLA